MSRIVKPILSGGFPGATLDRMRFLPLLALACSVTVAAQTPDWARVNEEALRHFQALVRIDSTDPPGNETRVVDYLKKVLDAEGIPNIVVAKDPARANLIARLKGNGTKKPLLIMSHSDTVRVDASKWTFPPFSATLDGGYLYGRGALDDKSNLFAALTTMVQLKRSGMTLDRDVIFVSEAGEEASTGPGIQFLVQEHWNEIEAEICLAEGGGVRRIGGQVRYGLAQTTEKQPRSMRLVAHGPSGHGSRPLRTNAVLRLARAVEKVSMWDPPMRFNDTTRYYFEKLAGISDPADAARYKALFDPQRAAAVREYLAENDPGTYSMLHTSISPNMFQAGYQVNVIPSEAQATLDVRALPDEDMPAFIGLMKKVINDPTIEIVPQTANQRPGAAPSRIDTDGFKAIEAAYRSVYNAPTLPLMATGATDMAFLRGKGVQCYGIGPMVDLEDAAKGYGAHSDQERILVEAAYKHLRFMWEVVTSLAASKK
ncbi:MAG TPA: M20/M25/M40 family metallo-hydrolase [Bryobacteraceae bacterium]|nr:M20/M25/M40 family metallo-hydrolase [Bryobacteraceae bacterium]